MTRPGGAVDAPGGAGSPGNRARERDRYRRQTFGDRLDALRGWFPAHPRGSIALAILVAVLVVLRLLTPANVRLGELAVGDCLFVSTPAAGAVGPSARPAGDAEAVRRVLVTFGAERAPCDGSHSHEVSAVLPLAPGGGGYPGDVPLMAVAAPLCEGAFEGFIGHAREGSAFDTLAVVPNEADWSSGIHTAACLVYARSGQFLDRAARASGG